MQGLFLTSTSNYLWLEFSSDQETTAAGFQLTYYSKSHFITRSRVAWGRWGGGGGRAEGRRTLKHFQMSEFALTSGAKHFMELDLKEMFN